jgi:hypothetical protein
MADYGEEEKDVRKRLEGADRSDFPASNFPLRLEALQESRPFTRAVLQG